jgi:hypothetical protein
LLDSLPGRLGIQAIGGRARCSVIHHDANRKPAILLSNILMNDVVGEARESPGMSTEKHLDVGNP